MQTHQLGIMKMAIDKLKLKMQQTFNLAYTPVSPNQERYQKQLLECRQFLQSKPISSTKDLEPFDELIVGSMEGSLMTEDVNQIVGRLFGKVDPKLLESYVKQKMDIKYYGISRNTDTAVRQAKDMCLYQDLFDRDAIKKHRKLNSLHRIYIKALKCFLQSYEHIDEKNEKAVSQCFQKYIKATNCQQNYESMRKKAQTPLILCPQVTLQQNLSIQQQAQSLKEPQFCETAKKELQNVEHQSEKMSTTDKKTQKIDEVIGEKISKKGDKKSSKKMQKAYGALITNFFKKKDSQIVKKLQDHESAEELKVQQQDLKKAQLFKPDLIGKNQQPLSQLRKQYHWEQKQPNKQSVYSNIFLWTSRLEFTNYFENNNYQIDYSRPFREYDRILYHEESSVEYEEMWGQICNQSNDQEKSEEQAQSANNTIVPDNYLSNDQIESMSQPQEKMAFFMPKGSEWVFTYKKDKSPKENPKISNYSMICLKDQQNMPFKMEDDAEQSKEISMLQKAELYKEIHGYYRQKENLISRLAEISEKMPKNGLYKLIRQISEKKNGQRLVKKEFIEEMKQHVPNIQHELDIILEIRNKEIEQSKDQKMVEKQLKIENLILDYKGHQSVIQLLKHLKDCGYKISKKELKTFFEARSTDTWKKLAAIYWNQTRQFIQKKLNTVTVPKTEFSNQDDSAKKALNQREEKEETEKREGQSKLGKLEALKAKKQRKGRSERGAFEKERKMQQEIKTKMKMDRSMRYKRRQERLKEKEDQKHPQTPERKYSEPSFQAQGNYKEDNNSEHYGQKKINNQDFQSPIKEKQLKNHQKEQQFPNSQQKLGQASNEQKIVFASSQEKSSLPSSQEKQLLPSKQQKQSPESNQQKLSLQGSQQKRTFTDKEQNQSYYLP